MVTIIGGGTQRVLLGACRLAAKSGKPGIWTDDVLRSLFQRVAVLGAVLDFPSATVAYHRDGGAGVTTASLPPELEQELIGALREAHWTVFGLAGSGEAATQAAPNWEDETVAAVRFAAALANTRRHRMIGRNHLLEALLSFQDNRASHYLRREQVDLGMLDEAMQRLWPVTDDEPPMFALTEFLEQSGILADPRRPARTGKGRWLGWATRLVTQRGPVLAGLEQQAVMETVRLGHTTVGLPHLMLAILTFEEQLETTGLHPLAAYSSANSPVLRQFGIRHTSAIGAAIPSTPDAPVASPQKRRAWHGNPRDPQWTASAARSTERVRGITSGSVHLLHSVLSDTDESGRQFLINLGIAPAAIEAELQRLATS